MRKKLREEISKVQHEAWTHWSKTLAEELMEIKTLILNRHAHDAVFLIDERLKKWKKNWVSYSKLSFEAKEQDREWADKILLIMGD